MSRPCGGDDSQGLGRGDDGDAGMGAEGEQMPVAGDDQVGLCGDRRGIAVLGVGLTLIPGLGGRYGMQKPII